MRKINISKSKRRSLSLVFLFVFFIFSQALISSIPASASVVERDIGVEWGDNVFQNLPYNYYGTFYENTDPTDDWDTAKIEFTYIPDTSINNEYTVTEDFTNSETKFAHGEDNLTMTDGTYSNFNGISHNDDNYATFGHGELFGIYDAVYSFENDLEGNNPAGWVVGEAGGTVQVIDYLDGHRKIVELNDTSGTLGVNISNSFANVASGTVEFWFRHHGNDHGIDLEYDTGTKIQLAVLGGIYKYNDGTWKNVVACSSNQWYHHKIVFDCGTDKFDWHIDGVLEGNDLGFKAVSTYINYFRVATWSYSSPKQWIDAVDYSWSDGYYDGRNTEVGWTPVDYSATYSFTNELDGTSGDHIGFVDEKDDDCIVEIVSSLGGHKKILYTHSVTTDGHGWKDDFLGQATGTIEFWIRLLQTNKQHAIQIIDGSLSHRIALHWRNDATIQLYDDSGWVDTGATYNADQWYHIMVDFDCSTDWHLWIDGISIDGGVGYDYRGTPSLMDRIILNPSVGAEDFFDAIDYSWDPSYDEGRNREANWVPIDFEATYSFESDNIDSVPSGWTDASATTVVHAFNHHNKVIELVRDGSNPEIIQIFTSPDQTSGTIELYFGSDDVTQLSHLRLYDGVTSAIQVNLGSEKIQYYSGGYNNIIDAKDNIFYHIRIDFECGAGGYEGLAADTFYVYVNGVKFGAYAFKSAVDYVDKLYFTCNTGAVYSAYVDAVGYSWESYNIGDNLIFIPSMLGNYPASYSFYKQPVWTSGINIDYVESLGGGCTGEIISVHDKHKKVLKWGGPIGATLYPGNFDAGGQVDGDIELWTGLYSGTRNQLIFREGATILLTVVLRATIIEFWYGDGAGGHSSIGVVYTAGTLQHIKISFDCATDKYSAWVGGVLKVNNLNYYDDHVVANMNHFYCHTNTANSYNILDAIAYSWDTTYNLGDNFNDNNYLGSETFEVYNMTNDAEAELEANGWTVSKGSAYNNISISGEFSSHKKILNLTDDSTTEYINAYNLFSAQISGTIEWWVYITDAYSGFYMISYGSGGQGFYLMIDNDQFGYYVDGSGVTWVKAAADDTWYHNKIVFDCGTDTFDWYIDGILQGGGDLDFRNVNTDISELRFQTITTDSNYSVYIDALSYSWEEPISYFRGSYNQHCAIESIMDFTVDIPFSYYESFILQINSSSRYFTSTYTNVTWLFYNFETNDWIEIENSASIVEVNNEYSDVDVIDGIDGLFDSNGNMKFRYYCFNSSAFYLSIDELTSNIYFGTQFEYEHTLQLLGTWKYRFKLDVGLGTEHIQDWIYFNVIEQQPNFEGISESRYSTRWVLTFTATSGEKSIVYEDDLTSGYWDLCDTTSDKTVSISGTPDKDAEVSDTAPNTNYGSDTTPVTRYQHSPLFEYQIYLEWDYSSEPYLKSNSSDTSKIYVYCDYASDPNRLLTYYTTNFDESTITWNNKPAFGALSKDWPNPQIGGWRDVLIGTPNQWYGLQQYHVTYGQYALGWKSKEHSYKPTITHYFYKNYHTTSGEGYAYFQSDVTESLGLISPKASTNTSLNEGDTFTVDLQTTSDNALLKLYSGGELQQTINLLTANTETSRQEVEVIISEDVSFDQIKITSELTDTEYFKLYDIKAEHWVFESEEDQRSMYVEPFGQNDLIINNLGNVSLKIYENDILRTDTYITISYELNTYIFESPLPETVFVSFYDSNNEYLDFNKFTTYINYTLYEQNFINQRLTSREFYVDEDSTIYFNVYDSFDVNIYSASRLAKTFIDITLNVYTLKIKNEALDDSSYTLTKESVSKTGILFPDEIDEYKIASGNYTFAYIKGTDPEKSIDFTLSGDKLLKINRSQMCFLSYTNQRGDYLDFNQFKTYWNGTLLYENVFYDDIGINASIEIKDHYDISVKNHSFIVNSGDNYVPIALTMYSLKVMNQQEVFNHVNITRDPNYYESGYSWSEWVAPTEIIEFNLFAGYYKINLTNNEDGGSSSYEYTLNGDDVILITSGNLLSQVIYNIANVNSTIGNQITAVYINITNQNSNINNTIVSIDINIESMNSTLGNLLTDIDLNIISINNNISNLYTFTETNFLNLGNNINDSFTLIENNILAINNTISTLVIGLDGKITVVNATITTMFTEMNSQFIVVQSTLDFSFAFLNQTIVQIGNNISTNQIALNNLIIQRANEIDNSLIQISTLVNLINSSVVNESLVIQSLVNIIGNNITENHIVINDLINLIGNNITENNINMVSLIELTGNNITTNQFIIQTLIDYVSNNITYNHLELLTNINFINNTMDQNQIELINRLLFINNSINQMAVDLTNQIIFVNDTIYSAILDVSTSIDFNSDCILGNISLTYQQNDFLTELYKKTMFSQLLNWSDVAYNYSLMEDRIDVWEFVNNYKNQSIEVLLRYNDLVDNLTVSAQNTIEQYLPNENVEYRLWSVANKEYLSEWVELPENRTVNFGFYEEVIPDIPDFSIDDTFILIILIIVGFVIIILGITIVLNKVHKKNKKYRKTINRRNNFERDGEASYYGGKENPF